MLPCFASARLADTGVSEDPNTSTSIRSSPAIHIDVSRGRELKGQLGVPTIVDALVDVDALVINLSCVNDASDLFYLPEDDTQPLGLPGQSNLDPIPSQPNLRGFVRVQSMCMRGSRRFSPALTPEPSLQQQPSSGPPVELRPPALLWSPSRRALEVLVVQEEHKSRSDKGLHILSHNQRLAERLERLNLEMLIMLGDGNCQFRSISNELFGTQDHHTNVRRHVVQHIRTHQEEYEGFLGESFTEYLAAMSRAQTWGDELTLRAACEAYKVVVYVVTSDPLNWYLSYKPSCETANMQGEIFLTYIAPIHYNTVRRSSSLRKLGKHLSSSFRRLSTNRNIAESIPERISEPGFSH
mmetsp:Transcript_16382/g.28091  ORF Transcript_16382/g.28091 Transcript_16382/m.28091 type:complete len:354 (-) Transcript_16382:858-1919(-)